MKKIYFLTLYLIAIVVIFSKCKNETEPLSSENTLTAITVNDENKNIIGIISDSNLIFDDSAVAGTTQVTVKAIQFSDKASANVKKNDVIPLNKTLTITAENGSTKNYMMSINVSVATMTGDGMTTTDTGDEITITGDEMIITDERTTITGNEMSITGNEMTLTGSPVVPLIIEPITRAQLAIATITDSGATLSGSFVKVNNPLITEMGILVTTNIRIKLELNNTNEAPNGTLKLAATNEQIALANSPALTTIPFSFPITNLASFTTYYFRGYAIINGGNILYTEKIQGMTLAGKVRISNFSVSLPYNADAINSDGSFRISYYKDPSPIRSFGVLFTSGNGITLELNDENAPAGTRLITGNATAIAAATASTTGNLVLSASNLVLGTTYTFRGYVQNDAGITYTAVSRKTIPSEFTLIPDDNFRNAIVSCINTNKTTLSGWMSSADFFCAENFSGSITANRNHIRTEALAAITQFNYGYAISRQPAHLKIRSLSGIEQMVNLTRLDVEHNSLSSLDISANIALIRLNVANNSLTSLNVFTNTALTGLFVDNNSLRSLDISANTALNNLWIRNNSSLTCVRVDASQLAGGSNFLLGPPFINKDATQILYTFCP